MKYKGLTAQTVWGLILMCLLDLIYMIFNFEVAATALGFLLLISIPTVIVCIEIDRKALAKLQAANYRGCKINCRLFWGIKEIKQSTDCVIEIFDEKITVNSKNEFYYDKITGFRTWKSGIVEHFGFYYPDKYNLEREIDFIFTKSNMNQENRCFFLKVIRERANG
mgnify:CR=1 FL=1